MIVHNRPLITEADIDTVSKVLRSGWLASGPQTLGLEEDFIRYFGQGGACACSSGTAALLLALRGLGLGRGHKVAVPTYACSAVLNSVYYSGAEPVLVDVRPDDFNMNPKALAKISGSVDAAIAIHTYGAPADILALKAVVPLVIEDCCQSLGGLRDGRPLGTDGDAAVFSFYATKIITCGNGGLIWDKLGRVADWARDFREFDGRDRYKPRFNFHITDFQAALARNQFTRLKVILARRQAIAHQYVEVLSGRVDYQARISDPERMPYRFVLILNSREERDALMAFLIDKEVKAAIPIQKFELLHRYLEMSSQDFLVAEKLTDTTLSLPLYPALTENEVNTILKIVDGFFS